MSGFLQLSVSLNLSLNLNPFLNLTLDLNVTLEREFPLLQLHLRKPHYICVICSHLQSISKIKKYIYYLLAAPYNIVPWLTVFLKKTTVFCPNGKSGTDTH